MSYKSGTKFRSRKIDNKRPLAVYRSSELSDLNELTNLSRAAPMVATGVEKEEEEVWLIIFNNNNNNNNINNK